MPFRLHTAPKRAIRARATHCGRGRGSLRCPLQHLLSHSPQSLFIISMYLSESILEWCTHLLVSCRVDLHCSTRTCEARRRCWRRKDYHPMSFLGADARVRYWSLCKIIQFEKHFICCCTIDHGLPEIDLPAQYPNSIFGQLLHPMHAVCAPRRRASLEVGGLIRPSLHGLIKCQNLDLLITK